MHKASTHTHNTYTCTLGHTHTGAQTRRNQEMLGNKCACQNLWGFLGYKEEKGEGRREAIQEGGADTVSSLRPPLCRTETPVLIENPPIPARKAEAGVSDSKPPAPRIPCTRLLPPSGPGAMTEVRGTLPGRSLTGQSGKHRTNPSAPFRTAFRKRDWERTGNRSLHLTFCGLSSQIRSVAVTGGS